MKMLDCLPAQIANELQETKNLRELRIRNGGAVKVNVSGRWYYLGVNALCVSPQRAIAVGNVCDDIVKKACCNSVYAHEKTLANGFFTLEDGVRVGVCGHVFGADKSIFQRYTSLCFRVPHYVNCVSVDTLKKCCGNNVLVIGSPGAGKTTFLRDLAVKLGQTYNVLVVDERGELFYDEQLVANSGCDVLKWATKPYAFEVGLRSMAPDYIVCDELTESDGAFVKACISSGVNLICSAHAFSIVDFNKRFALQDCFGIIINLNEKKSVTSVQEQ